MALNGAIGIIHHNNTALEQAREVERVKRFEQGFISNPITISPDSTVADVYKLKAEYGFSGFPVVDSENGKLLGLVASRDIDFVKNLTTPVKDIMTPFDKLIIKRDKASLTLKEANETLQAKKVGKLPVVKVFCFIKFGQAHKSAIERHILASKKIQKTYLFLPKTKN